MSEYLRYCMSSANWLFIRGVHALIGKYCTGHNKYGSKDLQSVLDGNDAIYKGICSGKPFACCRYGYVEIDLAIMAWTNNKFGKPFPKKSAEFCDVFATDYGKKEGLLQFGEIMHDAGKRADVLCLWDNMKMSDYYISQIPDVERKVIANAGCIEPFTREKPWTRALHGKKVLVINPFASVIETQYKEKREKLFINPDVLPEFHLETMDSIWYSQAGKDERFRTWFEAYDYLFDEALKRDFDIALLGCGLFGFPLAARLKSAGKQAVHMGSASQLLFGITGKRWQESGGLAKVVNENWVTPPKALAPSNPEKLDNCCYW